MEKHRLDYYRVKGDAEFQHQLRTIGINISELGEMFEETSLDRAISEKELEEYILRQKALREELDELYRESINRFQPEWKLDKK